jgi:hypothetical protein
MGNLVNGCVILVCMLMFGQAGSVLTSDGSRGVIMVQFAVAAAVSLFMTVWRYTKLKESKVRRSSTLSRSRAANSTKCTRSAPSLSFRQG